jgi:hypothetical protein
MRFRLRCSRERRRRQSSPQYKRDTDAHGLSTAAIDGALRAFWLDRAERAPTALDLGRHVAEEREFLADMSRKA